MNRAGQTHPIGRAWLTVALLGVVGALNYLDRMMITTMRQSIVAAMPMTDAQFGLLTSTFLWVYALLSPFAGFLADRFNRSRLIVGSLFVWSAVTWLTAHAANFNQLLVTRALMGISEACYIPAALALIADYHSPRTRSLATGVHMAALMLGQALGGFGGWSAEHHTWAYPFSRLGSVGLVYAVVLFFILRDPPAPAASESSPASLSTDGRVKLFPAVGGLLTQSSFLLALAFWGLLGGIGGIVAVWMPTYFQEHFALTQGRAGFSVSGYLYFGSFCGVLLGGALADRWAIRNPRGRILVPAIGLCMAAPAIFVLNQSTVLTTALIGLVVYGTTRSFSDANMMPILCLIGDPRSRATGYGILNLCSCTTAGLGVYLAGSWRDAHVPLNHVFVGVVLALLLAAFFLWLIKLPSSHLAAPAPGGARGSRAPVISSPK
jgi:MFS family permease